MGDLSVAVQVEDIVSPMSVDHSLQLIITGLHPAIHVDGDTLENIGLLFADHVTKLLLQFSSLHSEIASILVPVHTILTFKLMFRRRLLI